MTSSTSTEFRQLLRAQTIEGYAARHSKLAKSVTFDRETLQTSTEPTVIEYPEEVKSVGVSVQSMGIQVGDFRDISAGLVAVGVQTGFPGSELSPLVERIEEDSNLVQTSPNRVKFVKSKYEIVPFFTSICCGHRKIALKGDLAISGHKSAFFYGRFLLNISVFFEQRTRS